MFRGSLFIVAALMSLLAATAQAQERGNVAVGVAVEDPADARHMSGVVMVSDPFEPGEHWLGIMCVPADPALRAQLNLPERQGLLVVEVMPDSPAAKAGVARHDVLLSISERKLTNPRDLVETVEKAKDAAVKIELIRGGKQQTIEVAPAKRPDKVVRKFGKRAPDSEEDDWRVIEQWVEGMKQGPAGTTGAFRMEGPVRFRFFQPGAIVPDTVITRKPMPANLSVTIAREGEQPAKIAVSRDNDKWELTEKDLDQLPAEVRPFVERMLGRDMMWFGGGMKAFDMVPDVTVTTRPGMAGGGGTFTMPVPPQAGRMQAAPMPGLDLRIERRFDEMNRRMDQLFKMMEELAAGLHEGPDQEE